MIIELKDTQDLMEQIQVDALVLECKNILIKNGYTTEEELDSRLKFNSQQRIREILAQLDAERLEFDTMSDKSQIPEEKQQLFLEENDKQRRYYSQALVELYN
nr:MAG TPA: hypothetical protein [Caudoviricetes sp.]